ncbi:MAG TPA: chromate efflux transporter [Streptosporangiaceae bacterium]|nr:chromate efflux transporter [Streptosporangiaceae bacterium]
MTEPARGVTEPGPPPVGLGTIAREWTRIGVTGFGGPPAHIALLRGLCVQRRGWLRAEEFEDGIAATSLLPGPASTQLAIFCAWRLRGWRGALLGGACFILPGLAIILGLSALFLARHPPLWVRGVSDGAGAAVPAVAVGAALGLVPASWKRVTGDRDRQGRWAAYLLAGGVCGALAGQYLVFVLLACGLTETVVRHPGGWRRSGAAAVLPLTLAPPGRGWLGLGGPGLGGLGLARLAGVTVAGAGLGSLAWVAVKVGALSFGGGFVIIPLMQHDAVSGYHWMTNAQFLNAVALGQITPGPVVQTVAVVGYAAAGVGGGLLASLVAFTPSFLFVLVGAPHFDRLRRSAHAQALLTGAGTCAIGGIGGVAIPLALGLAHLWQAGVTLLAALWLIGLRRGVVAALIGCGALGAIAAFAHAPLS